jgi:Uma2 family endonuclease
MPTQTRAGVYAFADFLELIHEEKADLIDGVIHMASPESTEHNALVLWLAKVLGWYIEERRLGRLTVNKVAYRLNDRTAPEPDLGFVRLEREAIIRKGYVDGPPDLAVEIVSGDSVDRDYESKRRRYEQAGVAEYWIIDPDETRATFLVRGAEGFVESSPVDHLFTSRILPGFVLDVRWLCQRPLPPSLPIVQKLLGRM